MSEIEIRNANIKDARITTEDGFLTVWLDLGYPGGGQGFGGFVLGWPGNDAAKNAKTPASAGHFISRVMDIAGARDWNQVRGRIIRVKAEHNKVHAIGHAIEDDWFNPTEDFAKMIQATITPDPLRSSR